MKKITSIACLLFMTLFMKAQITETYDFSTWATSLSTNIYFTFTEEHITVDGKELYIADYAGEPTYSLNNRFAFQNDQTAYIRKHSTAKYNGLFCTNNTSRFSILNLNAGDKITITISSGNFSFLSNNAYSENDASQTLVNIGDVIASNVTYIVATGGQVDIKGANAYISNISIITSAAETVSSPSHSVIATNGNERTVQILPGTSSGGSEVKTYYTTNGDVPNQSSPLYENPITISATTTIKIISYIGNTNVCSDIYETTVEAGFPWPLNENIVGISNMIDSEDNGKWKNAVIDNVYDNNGVLGKPEVTFSYTFNNEVITLPYTVIKSGTLIATATANGYATKQEEYSLAAAYQLEDSIDFSVIEKGDLPEGWTINNDGNTRWANWDNSKGNIYSDAKCNTTQLTDFLSSDDNGKNLLIGYGLGNPGDNRTSTYSIQKTKNGSIALYETNEDRQLEGSKLTPYYIHTSEDEALSHSVKNGDVVAKVAVYSPILILEEGQAFSPNHETYAGASYTRMFNTKYSYGTICLPFVPDERTCANYHFYEFCEEGNNSLIFEEVETPEANKAYLYSLKDGVQANDAKEFTCGEFTVTTGTEDNLVAQWHFIGSLENKTINCKEESGKFYYYNPSTNLITQVTGTLTIAPYWAYFHYTGNTPQLSTMRLVFGGKDEGSVTSIKKIKSTDIEKVEMIIYDLNGRNVKLPVRGNIYIKNGKKTIY